ncbi:hypothetical protein B7P43_G16518 [Cryptotermes secundus]|uniref:Uncharacterized protein n=1 Tax=Cryptotermes secundus TaxID=105785 RepID=A0A2J7QM21_9NEOP|nr:hypothetical protein B7P43_G16518 [Cryptotermes secundus]
MWVHHYEPESKSQSMGWKQLGSQMKMNFKTQSFIGNVILTVFGTLKGLYCKTTWKKGARYSDLLANNLKPAIRTKCRGLLSKTELLLHDNEHSHKDARPFKPLTICVLRCWNTLPTAQISPFLIIISLDRSKMFYEVFDFLRTKKWGKRCINGCATNRKPSSWREYASFWTTGPSASKREETM